MSEQQNMIQTALNAATKPFVFEHNGVSIVATPSGNGDFVINNPSWLQSGPSRPRGSIQLNDSASFIKYVKAHQQDGTQVFIDANFERGRIDVSAPLNGHHGTSGGWNDWVAKYSPALTPDARAWMEYDKRACDQASFASFLTNHVTSIVSQNPNNPDTKYPNAAEVLDFALKLEVTKTLKFARHHREQDGTVNFQFKEENNAATEQRLQAFEKFGVMFQPYLNGPAYFMEAFLKFRTDNNTGSLNIWYELQGVSKVIENATADISEQIQTALGDDVPVYQGSI